jgi:hypothetical protein
MSNEVGKLARAQAIIVALFLAGCTGQSLPQHVEWVRADGKPISNSILTRPPAEPGLKRPTVSAMLVPPRKRPKQSTMYLLDAWPTAVIMSFDRIYAERSG